MVVPELFAIMTFLLPEPYTMGLKLLVVTDENVRFVSRIRVNDGRTGREWMVLIVKFECQSESL